MSVRVGGGHGVEKGHGLCNVLGRRPTGERSGGPAFGSGRAGPVRERARWQDGGVRPMVTTRIRMDADAQKGCRRGFGSSVRWPNPFMDLPQTGACGCVGVRRRLAAGRRS